MDPSLPRLPVVVALLLGFAQATRASQVSYCGGICPEFQVLFTNSDLDYEEREYDPVEWMCTDVADSNTATVLSARNTLQGFRKDQEEQGVDLSEETWPGMVEVEEIDNVEKYKLCWLIPPWVTGVSSDGDVTVESFPRKMFVKTFGGTPSIASGKENALVLKQALGKGNKTFNSHLYFGVGYDPFLAFTHHNEIWIPED